MVCILVMLQTECLPTLIARERKEVELTAASLLTVTRTSDRHQTHHEREEGRREGRSKRCSHEVLIRCRESSGGVLQLRCVVEADGASAAELIEQAGGRG